ncbi:hypothetical protein [Pseudomonas sp. NPDC087614]|uniref:hypothetical protein n=1 Tax=Pseudomonas sp. NPDC087614 TaxID=3364442 RepID=UPI0037FF32C6
MSFSKRATAANAEDTVITVSAVTVATITDRVEFNSQFAEFHANPASSQISLVTHANAGGPTYQSAKSIGLTFDRNIEPGTYSVTDPEFPFQKAYYGEAGVISGATTSFNYYAKSGTFTVEVMQATPEKLHYRFKFNFMGVNARNQELRIAGDSTYIVLLRPV